MVPSVDDFVSSDEAVTYFTNMLHSTALNSIPKSFPNALFLGGHKSAFLLCGRSGLLSLDFVVFEGTLFTWKTFDGQGFRLIEF